MPQPPSQSQTPPPPVTNPSPPAAAPAPSGPQFTLGFATLKALLGPVMGDPIENEHGNPDNCDTQQLTTTGLAYWRCSTNLMTFAALPDGQQHWAWTPDGLVAWTGADADPPPDAAVVPPPAASAGAPQAEAVCSQPADGPSTACTLANGADVLGSIAASGDSNAYRVGVGAPGAELVANLIDLPADYDLYLVDASGAVIGQSVLDGMGPRSIDMLVAPGTYYLYVHSDPGRAADPDNPYRLQLSLSTAPPTTGATTPPS